MIRIRAFSTLRMSLLLPLLLLVDCRLTSPSREGETPGIITGPGTFGIAGDGSWTSYDRILVVRRDERGADTLFYGKLLGLDTLERLPANGYAKGYYGGQAVILIQGFRNGDLAYEERRSYVGSVRQAITIDTTFDPGRRTASPSLDIRPGSVRLYLGGAPLPLEVLPAMREGRALAWKTGNPAVAVVSRDGVLSAVGEGATFVQAASGDTLRDASAVRVVRDYPKVSAGSPDTAVAAGIPITFYVTVTQEYGDVAAFAWDLDGDGAFDDSAAGTVGQTLFATSSFAFATGEVNVRFRVRDGEGNFGEARKLIKVSLSAPHIDSLEALPAVVTIHDSVAFSARAAGVRAGLGSFAWDFDGNGTDESTGSLQGDRAAIAGGHRYSEPATYRARLRIVDANGVSVSADVPVIVKLDRPAADAGLDQTALPGAEVRLRGRGNDTLGRIVSRAWKCGAEDFTPAADSGEHAFKAPSTQGTTYCVFRVIDDDALAAEDTLKVIVNEAGAPAILSFTPADTTLSIRDSVAFSASAAAGTGGLKAYGLDVDGDGKADLQGSLSGETGSIRIGWRFPSAGKSDVTLTVEDQSGKIAKRQARVLVLPDPPKAGAGGDTAVYAGTWLNLRGTASDSLGSVSLREWKIGTGPYVRVSKGDTSVLVLSAPGELACLFRVTDDDGQTAEDSVLVTVLPSPIAALAGLTVSTGSLSPPFSPQTYAYAVSVPDITTGLAVNPTAMGPGAAILVNGTPVASGAASGPVDLESDATIITISVTAQDTAFGKSYTVTVTRRE
jgi:cadherin-like protein/K319-like protein